MPLQAENLLSLERCPLADAFLAVAYPWDILAKIPHLIEAVVSANPQKYEQIAPSVWVGKGTDIASSACLMGPALIGADCRIRPHAYLRQNVITGDGVVIGHSSEVKQSVLFDEVQVPHFNYVGDSVLGCGVHLGAGVILSNFKSFQTPIKIVMPDRTVQTGLVKLGAILGDGVEIGCNAVLNPGTVIGPQSIVYPLSSVRGYIPGGMIYKGPGEVVPRR